ncbi:MAG: hypothetical protein ABSC55_02980 [Syntrophorhabdales bacterium]|jgi:hypothetical protein
MAKEYRTLEQLLCLISFFICAGVIGSLTLVLKTLVCCGCFRQHADPDRAHFAPFRRRLTWEKQP